MRQLVQQDVIERCRIALNICAQEDAVHAVFPFANKSGGVKIKIAFLFVTVGQAIRKILLAFFLFLLGELALKQQVGVPGDFFLFWSMLKLAFGNQLINFRIFLRRAGQSDHKFQMFVHQILIILHGFTFPP